MPALTHGRVKNGFNGYATRVRLPNGGGLSNTQPVKYNGGQKPKRNFKAEYNAQVNAPNALTNSIGSSFTTKRANARRAGDPNRKLLGLPEVSFSAPGQAGNRRKVSVATGKMAGLTLPAIYPNSFSFVVGSYVNVAPVFKGLYSVSGANTETFGKILPPNYPAREWLEDGNFGIYQDTGLNAPSSSQQNFFLMPGFPPNTTKTITMRRNNVILPGWTARPLTSNATGLIIQADNFNYSMPKWADGDIIKVEFLD